MSRVCLHVVPQGERHCTICGTSAYQISIGFTCIWRDTPDDRLAKVLPEPKLRTRACEDTAMISGRMDELQKERDAALNREAEE